MKSACSSNRGCVGECGKDFDGRADTRQSKTAREGEIGIQTLSLVGRNARERALRRIPLRFRQRLEAGTRLMVQVRGADASALALRPLDRIDNLSRRSRRVNPNMQCWVWADD